jgi:HAMP domain-containing protein
MREVFSAQSRGYVLGSGQVLGYARSAGPERYRSIVSRFPGFNWTVLVQQPTSIALAPIEGLSLVQAGLQNSRQQMLILLGIVIFLVFALAIVTAGMLSDAITRPLLNLRELADAVSKGDVSRSISVKSNDEFEDVAQAFERMRTSVSILMKRLTDMKGKIRAA